MESKESILQKHGVENWNGSVESAWSSVLDAMDEYAQHIQSDLDKCNARIKELEGKYEQPIVIKNESNLSKEQKEEFFRLINEMNGKGQFTIIDASYSEEEMEHFSNWKDDTGWLRRPFPEKSGVYLWDDHSVEDFNFDNGKTHSDLLKLYNERK